MKSIVEKAREIVTHLYERNMVSWNDLDREVVFTIQALNAEVQRMQALPQRTWVGLTDEEQRDIAYSDINCWDWGDLIDAVEAKIKEKNT